MLKKVFVALAAIAMAGTVAAAGPLARASGSRASSGASYEPRLDPANFVAVIDNPYYPLPVGRTLVYHGFRDGQSQVERVTITHRTRVLEGITATEITDVATHGSALLEKTSDWYAQDKQGNVWYLGEDTKAYNPDGSIDTSGSWLAGVEDGEPGIIMQADPNVPAAYRQEFLLGQAQDTAWTVDRGGSVTVPYGTLYEVLTSLEATQVEPGSFDEKIYAPGIGIVFEKSLTSDEVGRLVSVTN